MKKLDSFDTTPDISLTYKLGEGNYDAPQAISELAANSFDARVGEENVEIKIQLSGSSIEIQDNGKGMSLEVLGQALTLGATTNVAKSKARKGLFGLGLKVACASIGMRYTVITKDLETGASFSVEVDLESLKAKQNGDWNLTPYQLSEEEANKFFAAKPSGTIIQIGKLKHAVRDFVNSPGALHKKLLDTYGAHLKSGDVISINGNQIEPRDPSLLTKYTVEIDTTIDVVSTGQQIRVTGWGGLSPETHNKGDYGFHLFRNQQLIVAHSKKWFRAHLMTSRVMGEVEIVGVPTNFSKDGFDETSEEWVLLTEKMTEIIRPLAKQSGNMAKLKTADPPKRIAIDREFRRLVDELPEDLKIANPEELGDSSVNKDGIQKEVDTGNPDSDKSEDEQKLEISEFKIIVDGKTVSLAFLVEAMGDEDNLIWDYLFDEESSQLQTVVNEDSPVFQSTKDPALLAALATADSLMMFLVREWGHDLSRAMEVRNMWINERFRVKKQDG